MKKLLIGTVVWCPKDYNSRALNILEHFNTIVNALDNPSVDVIIINNEVENESVLAKIKELKDAYADRIYIKENYPQVGWARGRNQCIVYFQSSDKYSNLAMVDCDIVFEDNKWTYSILNLHESHPELHAYMIRPDKYEINKTVSLSKGLLVDLYQEWLGTTNVIDHVAAQKVGGYDSKIFPVHWGFSDPEIGRRYRYSNLLESTKGYFIDPIRVTSTHLNSNDYNSSMDEYKKNIIRQYNNIFITREREIKEGKVPYYFDPSI